MKTKFTWAGIVASLLLIITTFFVGCKKDDMNDVIVYRGQVVYINTTTPFPDLTVKVTNGNDTHCQTQTDAGGTFSLKVRVSEIDGSYYLLAGDETCVPKKVGLGGYGQAQVDLGVIEVEGPALPTIKTTALTEVTAESATLGGEVMTDGRLAVTARGICYGTEQQPTIDGLHTTDGSGLGVFTTTLKNLDHNTIFYARAYATNKMGTAYGDQVKFTTELGVPIVISDSVYRITAHSAKCKGHVESDGGYAVSKKGTCWSRQPDPTVDDECTNDGSGIGEFTSTLNNLLENTTYYVRTYATNATSTVYGEQIIITTLDGLAVVKTDSVNNVSATGFTAFGTVVSDCDIPVTARGFCYSASQYPTIEDAQTTSGKGIGQYKSNITKLEYGTTYYVRAYATNATATTYGEQITVKTLNGLPTVTTAEVTNIGSVKATCGGNVTDDGTLTVTARGVCYGTNQYPTTEGLHTVNGKGKGEFVSNLTDLKDKTTYYVRAYATTDAGTVYGEQKKFKTENGVPVVLLSEVGEPTANSVICKGHVTGDGGVTVTERGFCYSVSQYPTNTSDHVAIGNGVGEFTGSLTGLALNTTYYVRAYAVNSLGIGYSEQKSFTTKNGLATITTGTVTATATSIAIGGNVTDNGGYAVTERGVCYSSTNSEPTISDAFVVGGKGNGEFSVSITGLSASKTYYVRAYATNENGTSYGNAVTVTTKDGTATVALGTITNITALTASASVTVSDAGSATLQSCGICWATHPNPTITDSKTIASGKVLNTAYTCNLAELQPNTIYYVRAYATTDVATSYSQQKTFTTTDGAATISIGEITNVMALSATGSVTVSDVGGAAIQSCGICWSTNPSPTVTDNKTPASGKQLNTAYPCTMSGLLPNTTYYVRGYATTDITTSYSEQKTFTTTSGLPTIQTSYPSSVTAKSVSITGNVTANGGYNVTARGCCYSKTNSTPTIADSKIESGSGNGSFELSISNLEPNTDYYVCAYATNAVGTAYSSVRSFKTLSGRPTVTSSDVGYITTTTAQGNVYVEDAGGATLQSCGVCWSTNSNPSITDHKSVAGGVSLKKNYLCDLSGLTPGTTYYVRGYATTDIATVYTDTRTFTTLINVSGVVKNESGAGISGAKVAFKRGNSTYGNATTDASGAFALQLAANTYTIQVTASGYSTISQLMEVTATPISLVMQRLGVLLGKVYDDDNIPLANATVTVRSGTTTVRGVSGSDGSYRVEDVPLGQTSSIDCSLSGYNLTTNIPNKNIVSGANNSQDIHLTITTPAQCSSSGFYYECTSDGMCGSTVTNTFTITNNRQKSVSWSISGVPAKGLKFTPSSGTISANATWEVGDLYVVTENLTILNGATITIEPGVIVKFASGKYLTINSGGTLNAIGSRTLPIVFTSIKDDVHGGDTNGDGAATTPQAERSPPMRQIIFR